MRTWGIRAETSSSNRSINRRCDMDSSVVLDLKGESMRRVKQRGGQEVASAIQRAAERGQHLGDASQFDCRPWSVSLTRVVSRCGEGGQLTGGLHNLVAVSNPRIKYK